MTNKYLRSASGVIFDYTDRMAADPTVTVVTEQEAFPERFAPVDLAKREQKVELKVDEAGIEAPPYVAPELLAEGTRAFSGKVQNTKRREPKDKA